ncbi:MAG: hypothetical protein QM773_05500 [Hyphomonadaceae bacterium]
MIDGVDMSRWNGIRAIREKFRACGFGLPDRLAELASAACSSEFAAEDFVSEGDEHATRYIRQQYPETASPRNGPNFTKYEIRCQVGGSTSSSAKFPRP